MDVGRANILLSLTPFFQTRNQDSNFWSADPIFLELSFQFLVLGVFWSRIQFFAISDEDHYFEVPEPLCPNP